MRFCRKLADKYMEVIIRNNDVFETFFEIVKLKYQLRLGLDAGLDVLSIANK